MRASHFFIGLVGLAGLVVAAPAPTPLPDAASINQVGECFAADGWPSRHKVAPPTPCDATSPAATSIDTANQVREVSVCFPGADGWPSCHQVAPPTPRDASSINTANQLREVSVCFPGADGWPSCHQVAPPTPRDATSPAATSTPTTNRYPTDPAGTVRVCLAPASEGPTVCKEVNAVNQCQYLDVGFAGKVRTISQPKGAVCKFYVQETCFVPGIWALEIDSRQSWKYLEVTAYTSEQIVSVFCFVPRPGEPAARY